MKKKVLICVAHSDDEVLGCGGVIQYHRSKGDDVYCMNMTNGVSSREYNARTLQKKIQERKESSAKAAKILDFKWLDEFSNLFEDNKLDNYVLLDLVKVIEKAKKKINPQVVYTHFKRDLSIDHRLTHEAVVTAFRPQNNEVWTDLISFEIPSSTDYNLDVQFKPNYIIDITKFLKKKIEAFKMYKEEIKKAPHSRSLLGIKTLASYRGVQNGIQYGEAFEILKKIKR